MRYDSEVDVVGAPGVGDEQPRRLGDLVARVVVGHIAVRVGPVPSVAAHDQATASEHEVDEVLVVGIVVAVPELVEQAVDSR